MTGRRSPRLATSMALLTLVVAATACTADTRTAPSRPPPTTAAAPTLTPALSWPRYDPLAIEFCEHINWDDLTDALHITITQTEFTDWFEVNPSRAYADYWWAGCGFDALTDDGTFRPHVSIRIDVFEASGEARQEFEGWVTNYRDLFEYDSAVIHGWWDQGARSTRHRPYASDYQYARVLHHVLHNNLYIQLSMEGGYRVEDPTGEKFLTLVDDLSLALIEQITAHVLCRTSPGADPTSDCH